MACLQAKVRQTGAMERAPRAFSAIAAPLQAFARRIGEDWTDRAILFAITLCCLVIGRVWAGGRPLPEAALPGIFIACWLVGLRAPAGELCRRVWRVWVAWVLALTYVGAIHGLANLFSFASDMIWLQGRHAWYYGGLDVALGWAAWSVVPAVLGALVAAAVRRWRASQRMPFSSPSFDASDVDLFLWLGLLFVLSFIGHQWPREVSYHWDGATVIVGFAVAAARAPYAEQFARIRKLWVGVFLLTYSFSFLPMLLVALYEPQMAWMLTFTPLELVFDALAQGLNAFLGGGVVWLVRYVHDRRFSRPVEAAETSRGE